MSDFDVLTYSFDHDIDIIPVSDVHLGSMEHRHKEWLKFCKDIESKPDTYLALVGDLFDVGIPNSKTDVFSQTMSVQDACDQMIENLLPLKDRILFLVEGNHEHRITLASSLSPTKYVATALGIPERFRENAAFCILRFGSLDKAKLRNMNGSKRPTYTLSAVHGATKNRDKNLGLYADADINITGHTHSPDLIPKMKYKFDCRNNQMLQCPYYHVVTSSWLDWGGYGLAKLYEPSAFCIQTIHLSNNKKEISIITK